MRLMALVIILTAGCGDDGNAAQKDAALPNDVAVDVMTVDAPPLATCAPVSGTKVSVRLVGQVPGSALLVTSPPGDGRLFVVMQDGTIRIFENEVLRPEPFLDLSNTNLTSDTPQGERGLLGLAFHPNYANNREFYVFYTTVDSVGGNNIVARYHASATDLNKAETTGEIVLSIPDFANNHNGGMIQFGKDGYLYVGTGDGGDGGDPCRNGQAIDRGAASCTSPPTACTNSGAASCEPLLGKILRIDVNTTAGVKNYGIPADNPFAAGGGEPEIFVIGLRNPWRWSFDRLTGDLWIGDVGQGTDEEMTVLKAGAIGGKNLGWSMYEATRCYGNYTCSTAGITMPQFQRNQTADGWKAIIGGEVYRGTCYPDLVGTYFMSDNTAHPLVTATLSGDTVTATTLTPPASGWPTGPASIHGDARGELYLTTTNGRVFHIEAGP